MERPVIVGMSVVGVVALLLIGYWIYTKTSKKSARPPPSSKSTGTSSSSGSTDVNVVPPPKQLIKGLNFVVPHNDFTQFFVTIGPIPIQPYTITSGKNGIGVGNKIWTIQGRFVLAAFGWNEGNDLGGREYLFVASRRLKPDGSDNYYFNINPIGSVLTLQDSRLNYMTVGDSTVSRLSLIPGSTDVYSLRIGIKRTGNDGNEGNNFCMAQVLLNTSSDVDFGLTFSS